MRPWPISPRRCSRAHRLFGLVLVVGALLAIAGLPSGNPPLVSPALAADATSSSSADPSTTASSPSPTDSPSATPSPAPPASASDSPLPSSLPSPEPSLTASSSPSPSSSPTEAPTPGPGPSASPSGSPSPQPSASPSDSPSPSPSASPTLYPLTLLPVRNGVAQLSGSITPAATTFVSPHTAYGLTTDTCATCHRGHSAVGPAISLNPAPESSMCFMCHDAVGTGSTFATAGELTGIPANDASTDQWYSHPVTSSASHTSDATNEFQGVLNQHSTCSDCHDSHNATAGRPTESASGWTSSGTTSGASSVAVTNRAGWGPMYTLVQGPTSIDANGVLAGGTPATYEYQLCFKCHSGFTVLPQHSSGTIASHPSWWELDKGVEFDPLNAKSFHPIEAQGTNQSAAMAASLSGASPYKLWNFKTTDTIRCTNCHAGPATPALGATPDALLPVHASQQRGILIAPYRDRVLMSSSEPYSAANFELCYLCHSEAPFVDRSGDARSDTNYPLHGVHISDIQGMGGGGTDIDTAGAGRGNAICAECHFRLHSTALAFRPGDQSNTGLVNFAPDVQPYNGVLKWTQTGVASGSCTLTCHGVHHDGWSY